jgi:hypothetical protein
MSASKQASRIASVSGFQVMSSDGRQRGTREKNASRGR